MKTCPGCGSNIKGLATCKYCGRNFSTSVATLPQAQQQFPTASPLPQQPIAIQPPPKKFITAWLFSLFLGTFGADRFYLGKVWTGFLKLATWGGLGIWYLIDLIIILAGSARDNNGLALEGYDDQKGIAWGVTGVIFLIYILFWCLMFSIMAVLDPIYY